MLQNGGFVSMRHELISNGRALLAALVLIFVSVAPALAQVSAAPQAVAPAPDATQSEATLAAQNYVLGVGDRLRIIVFGEEQLSGEFVIDSTGQVSLPLIGEVAAAGVTVRQFQLNVQAALNEGYLNDPRVSAEVMNFRPFYILGEVARPGEYPYASNLTVLNAVATAGGFAPLANQTRVYIKHAGEATETEMALSGGLLVQPGDTIRVAKGAFYILGEVNRPGEYAYSEGLTVMNAVATAGGFTYRANRGRVFIQRQGSPEEDSTRLRPDTQVMPGDTIRIGERFF
jgi:protein involved in polysaccharide export with SLBB domain